MARSATGREWATVQEDGHAGRHQAQSVAPVHSVQQERSHHDRENSQNFPDRDAGLANDDCDGNADARGQCQRQQVERDQRRLQSSSRALPKRPAALRLRSNRSARGNGHHLETVTGRCLRRHIRDCNCRVFRSDFRPLLLHRL
jgi:hypothetical protein